MRQPCRASGRPNQSPVAAAISDADRFQKTKGLAGNHQLTPAILGSPTWARTRDQRSKFTGAQGGKFHDQALLRGVKARRVRLSGSPRDSRNRAARDDRRPGGGDERNLLRAPIGLLARRRDRALPPP